MNSKEEFIKIVNDNINRTGKEELLGYLEEYGFYEEPASTKYHGSYPGGLLDHSLNVYYNLIEELKFILGSNFEKRYSMESIAIVSLFHDLCKIGRYQKGIRNVKNPDTGVWEQKEVYEYNPNYFTMGHASLSIHRIEKFMKLTDEEAQAIYWHMGAFDISQYSSVRDLSESYSNNTLAFALHRADMLAAHICENDKFEPIKVQ